jgi:ribosome-associated protein
LTASGCSQVISVMRMDFSGRYLPPGAFLDDTARPCPSSPCAMTTDKATPPATVDATPFALRGDYITLDALLKACGVAGSGGAAKMLIAGGGAQVNGLPETRRGRKLRAGDVVAAAGVTIVIEG